MLSRNWLKSNNKKYIKETIYEKIFLQICTVLGSFVGISTVLPIVTHANSEQIVNFSGDTYYHTTTVKSYTYHLKNYSS